MKPRLLNEMKLDKKSFAGVKEEVIANDAELRKMLAAPDGVVRKKFVILNDELTVAVGSKVSQEQAIELLVAHATMLPVFKVLYRDKGAIDNNPVSKVLAKFFALFDEHGLCLTVESTKVIAEKTRNNLKRMEEEDREDDE